MFAQGKVMATIAVSDIVTGKEFYGAKLGLKQINENQGGVTYESGGGHLFIYQAPTAGKGEATCAVWGVEDVPSTVEELKTKGITFEHYELPGATWEGDIAIMGTMQAAWFKDPDGNILSVGNA